MGPPSTTRGAVKRPPCSLLCGLPHSPPSTEQWEQDRVCRLLPIPTPALRAWLYPCSCPWLAVLAQAAWRWFPRLPHRA